MEVALPCFQALWEPLLRLSDQKMQIRFETVAE